MTGSGPDGELQLRPHLPQPMLYSYRKSLQWDIDMLVFIDESGHPHPNDATHRPVVVAVCISDHDSRAISGRVHSLKRDNLNRERMELKAVKLIRRNTTEWSINPESQE